MPINFPDSPTNGDTHTEGNRSWVYNSSTNSWDGGLSTITGSMASQNANGVAITGGTITGLTNLTTASLSASGNVSVGGNLTVDTNTLFVDSVNNRVGIGTTSPTDPLTVSGRAAIDGDILLKKLGNGTNRTISFENGYNTTALMLYDGGAGMRWGWGLRSGEMQFYGHTSSGHHFSWNRGGDLQNSGTNELMRLDITSGNLGIGTTAPNQLLHVKSSQHAGINLDAGVQYDPFYHFSENGVVRGDYFYDTSENILTFRTLESGAAMRFFNGGGTATLTLFGDNLGVGTHTPSTKLDVNGTLNASGNTTIGGTLVATGKVTANGQGALSALGANDVITKSLLDEYPFLAPYQPYFELSTSGGWLGSSSGAGAGTTYYPEKLLLRVAQLSTSYAFAQAPQLQIAPLGVATHNGYSRVDWNGKIFMDLTVLPAFGLTTSPFNQYRGVRAIHALCNGFRTNSGTNTYGEDCVITEGSVGIIVFTPTDALQEVRLIRGAPSINAMLVSGATNASPIVITTTSSAAHGLTTGNYVEVRGVAGNTAANGFWTVGATTATTFELSGSTGNGSYTSGGQWQATSPVLFSSALVNNRYTVSVQSGTATLFVNGANVGSLTGGPTGILSAEFYNILDNVGVAGVIGGANLFIRNMKVGGIY